MARFLLVASLVALTGGLLVERPVAPDPLAATQVAALVAPHAAASAIRARTAPLPSQQQGEPPVRQG